MFGLQHPGFLNFSSLRTLVTFPMKGYHLKESVFVIGGCRSGKSRHEIKMEEQFIQNGIEFLNCAYSSNKMPTCLVEGLENLYSKSTNGYYHYIA